MDSSPSAKSDQILEIMTLLAKVSEKFEPGENEMKQWMIQNFQSPVIPEILQDSTLMTLRVLNVIGNLEPINGISISKQSCIPKGTVSKITRRLISKKLITQDSLPNNKKDILFRMTPLGKEIFQAHQAFDQKMERGFINFLKKYDISELGFIVQVLEDFVEANFLDL
jgi:DNA-binding MarR family transcriptional regulator